jgi:putative DNA primase/helicase
MQKRAIEHLSPDQFAEWMAEDVEARRKGGPNLLDKYLRLVEQLAEEAREEYRAGAFELWSKVENDLAAPKPMVWINGRRYPADAWEKMAANNATASSFLPATQPAADETREDTRRAIAAKIIRREFPAKWAIPELAEPPVLVRKNPMDNAAAFARDMLTYHKGNLRALGTYFYRSHWWQWNGASYEPTADDQRIWDMLGNYLNDAKVRSGEEGLVRFRPETKHVNEALKFLRTCTGIDECDEPPKWTDDRPSPDPFELLAFRNCLVNVRTGETFGHDPHLWVHDGLGFDYPDKPYCPKWEWFLEDIHPGDDEAQMSIEEWLGYGMTWDNRFEKIAVWVGEPRSGRGTIASIQELLVGPRHHIPLDFHTWNSTENSKAGMLGKKVGIFHDVRLKEPKQWGNVAFDPGGLDVRSIEALLKFSSGDRQTIKEMWKAAVVERPKIKLTLLTNKILNLRDEALFTRLFLLYFGESRLGREDKDLKLRVLPSEISGIAWRCLAAYRQLRERDRLLEPKSGLKLVRDLKETQNHWLKFMNRYFQPAPEGVGVRVKVFNAVFRYWAMEEGRLDQQNASEGALIRGVRGIKEWQHLDWFRHNSEERQYPIIFKPGAISENMANTIKIKVSNNSTGRPTYELAYELLEAVGK